MGELEASEFTKDFYFAKPMTVWRSAWSRKNNCVTSGDAVTSPSKGFCPEIGRATLFRVSGLSQKGRPPHASLHQKTTRTALPPLTSQGHPEALYLCNVCPRNWGFVEDCHGLNIKCVIIPQSLAILCHFPFEKKIVLTQSISSPPELSVWYKFRNLNLYNPTAKCVRLGSPGHL